MNNDGVPMPIVPIWLRGVAYYPSNSNDVWEVNWMLTTGQLNAGDGFEAAKWLAQAGFYNSF